VGAALTAALRQSAALQPDRLTLRWRSPLELDYGFVVGLQSSTEPHVFQIHDDKGRLLADGTVTLKDVVAAGEPSTPAVDARPDSAAIARMQIERGIRAWQRDFHATLATLRRQRAWRVMLLIRGMYDQLLNKGIVAFLGFTAAVVTGRGARLEPYEPEIPEPGDYMPADMRDGREGRE